MSGGEYADERWCIVHGCDSRVCTIAGRACQRGRQPDRAPSPSIPDPSGERGEALPEQLRRIAADLDRINRPPSAAALRAAADELDAARARPASLPEAPEPEQGPSQADLEGLVRAWTAAGIAASTAATPTAAYAEGLNDAYEMCAVGLAQLLPEDRAATPSAPPVAVDPEAAAADAVAKVAGDPSWSLSMNLVNGLYEMAALPVDRRQALNDQADDFVLRCLARHFAPLRAAWDQAAAAGATGGGIDGAEVDALLVQVSRLLPAPASGGDGEGTGNDG